MIFSLAVEVNSTIKLFFFLYGMVDFTYGILYIHYVHKIYVCVSFCVYVGAVCVRPE